MVIGAGPSGSHVSALLARMGFSVRIVDLKEEIGIPNHCSGLVDRRVVEIVGDDLVIDRPLSATVFTPSGSFTLRSERMFVLDRISLDRKLAESALSEGATLDRRTMLIGLRQENGSVASHLRRGGSSEIVRSKYVIGADGPTSAVRRFLGFPKPKLLRSIQYDLRGKTDSVKIFLDRSKLPDFFAWEIPHGGETEIGASGGGSLEIVNALAKGEVIRKRGGVIPIGNVTPGSGNCFLVGDAAGMNKATTGGGLYGSLVSGGVLAASISDGGDVKEYGRRLLRGFGGEVNRALKLRNILDSVERYYGLWVPFVKRSINGINNVGDVDYPSKAFLYLLATSPLTFPLAFRNVIKNFSP
ncbi:MAG: FAD-dependent monooxygenase [Thermoplasmata archaeon]